MVKINIIKTEPEIMHLLEDIIQVMVVIFCLYLFWPFRKKYQIKKHDRDFGFAAGLFMLSSLDIFKGNSYFYPLKNLIEVSDSLPFIS